MKPSDQNRRYHQNLYHRSILFKKGQCIFAQGDERTSAYIVEQGEVEISIARDGKNLPLVRLGDGEIFGEMAIFESGLRTASATAMTDTHVFVISPKLMQERLGDIDPLVALFLNLLINRYRQARFRSADEVADGVIEKDTARMNGESSVLMKDWQSHKDHALFDLRIAQEIAHAIEERQFVPYLQPIVRLEDQGLIGFEALIRWNHPTKGILPPADFISVAERTEMVRDLDMQMLYQACILAPVLKNGRDKFFISVNLSGLYFVDNDMVRQIGSILTRTDVDPKLIKLEITETALVGTGGVAEGILKDLKAMGLSIALDDFGTGYSSLSYLHRFAIDTIKIDRSFIKVMRSESKSQDIIRAITGLAKNFSLDVVAEGIEEFEDISILKDMGCDSGQGYFFGKPMPVDKAQEFSRK